MGLLQRIKQSEANKTRKKAMKMVKRVQLFVKGVFAAVKILPIMTAAVVVTTTLGTVISFITDRSASDGTAKKTYEALEVQDLSELVEIKEDGNDGYYIDFKEDATEKLKSLTKTINKDVGSHNVPKDEEFLKEMIKAELITKFPNLGGTVPEDSEGFQGAVDLRRISPDKEIEELTQASNGETANIEQEETNDPNEDIGAYEDIVKGWKTGQELVVTKKAYAYEQQESTLNPGQGTGNWKNVYDSKENKVEIDKDTKVTYTGKYETNTNQSTKLTSTYVQVKIDEERTYFLKAQYLSTESKKDNESEARSITRTVEKTAKVTSRAKEEKETLGSSSKTYKIALRAVAGDGIETEELNEKELAEKVLNKLKKSLEDKYSNVEVSEADTRKEIREIDPDFAIVINFNIDTDKSKSGVDAIYRDGDEPSHQLGDILSANVAKSMGLTDLYAGSDLERIKSDLTAIDHFVTTEYPTALVRGGYFSSDNDVKIIKDNGVNKYAEGLLNGIEEYVKSDKSGYEAKKEQEKTAKDSIKSKVVKMKYVTPDKFKEYVESNSQEALKVYTLNDQFQIQTATWSSENGDIKISENTAIDFRTALQKYIMPYEYLLFFYTDSDYEDFSLELAKTAQEAEIVIALQDNVETKKTVVTTNEKKTITPKKYNSEYGYGWKETNTETTTTETCSTKVEYTYINTWCVKLYKESSYSSKILNMGDKDEIDGIDLKGTATYTKQTSETTAATKDEGEIQVADGLQTTPNGNDTIKYVKVKYKTQEKTETDIDTYNHNYDTGETKIEGKENVFVDLYQEKKMKNRIRPKWLFKILEKNEKTSNMVDLTKYLIYKATSVDYGVVEYDFNVFKMETFSGIVEVGDYIVKTDEQNAAPVVKEKATLQTGLTSWLKTSTKQRENALSVLDTVFECQEKYNVNAVFVYAFLRQETGIGQANTKYVNSDNNWGSWNLGHKFSSPKENVETIMRNMSTGSIYFTQGNISVSQIGAIYCPNEPAHPDQGDKWIASVENFMQEFYSAMGIQAVAGTGTVAAGGEGTLGVYTSSKGLKYNLYLQGSGAPWQNEDYGNDHNMGKAGCGPTAEAIIASAYNGGITPSTTRADIVKANGLGNHSAAPVIGESLKRLVPGIKVSVGEFNETRIKECLQNSGQIWLVVQHCKYTSGAHCMALIDYKDSNQVYVAHGTAKSRPSGWDSLSNIRSGLKYSQILYVEGK